MRVPQSRGARCTWSHSALLLCRQGPGRGLCSFADVPVDPCAQNEQTRAGQREARTPFCAQRRGRVWEVHGPISSGGKTGSVVELESSPVPPGKTAIYPVGANHGASAGNAPEKQTRDDGREKVITLETRQKHKTGAQASGLMCTCICTHRHKHERPHRCKHTPIPADMYTEKHMNTCACTCNTSLCMCKHRHTQTCKTLTCVCTRTHMYAHTCAHMHARVHMHVHAHIYAHIYRCMHACMHTCVHTCVHVCTYTYVHATDMYAHTHTCTHVHTCMHTYKN